jgi:hypothetical protein
VSPYKTERLDQVFHILKVNAIFKTLWAAKRMQFHRDETERACDGAAKTRGTWVPNVKRSTSNIQHPTSNSASVRALQ